MSRSGDEWMDALKKDLPKPENFQTIHVSKEAHDLVFDLVLAACAYATADTLKDKDTAYSELNWRRRDLYLKIQDLEAGIKFDRTTVRFD